MPIIRGAHDFDENFTRMPNRWLRDERLSLKAIGLLAQLHSHAVGWRVSVRSLADANACGLDLIRSAIAELEGAGYLRREQHRGDNNQFAESLWTTIDPSSGFPSTAFPSTDNPIHKKNNVKKNKLKKDMPDSHLTRFDEFWAAYPRRVGKNSAIRAYATARERFTGSATDYEQAVIQGAQRLAGDANLPQIQFVPYPTTWLNRDGWCDDPYPEREATQEQRAETQRRANELDRQRRIQQTQKALTEMNGESAPIPTCEHGDKLVSCRICLRNLSKKDQNE
jgi:hypothetical protein